MWGVGFGGSGSSLETSGAGSRVSGLAVYRSLVRVLGRGGWERERERERERGSGSGRERERGRGREVSRPVRAEAPLHQQEQRDLKGSV